MSAVLRAAFTIDVEPDCPPYLNGYRGMEHGMPRLLDLMADRGVRGTFFATGDVARRYPHTMQRVVNEGHELASHGMTHTAFDTMTPTQAEREIAESARVLRAFGEVTAFRAPYLRFPLAYQPLLGRHGIEVDCSGARYKRRRHGTRDATVDASGRTAPSGGPKRVDASLTSSVLRMPDVIRWPYMRAMGWPLVLFVHPWEFVDLRRERLRWDCRFRTGDEALRRVAEVFDHVRARGGEFVTVRELVA